MKYYAMNDAYMQQDRIKASFQEVPQSFEWRDSMEEVVAETAPKDCGLVLISSKYEGHLYETCETFAADRPNMTVVVLDFDLDLDMRRLMRSGVFDILSHPVHGRDLNNVIKDFEQKSSIMMTMQLDEEEEGIGQSNGKVVTVCSTKGGVGKTSFVVNIAASFEKKTKRVLVIDLDLQFGDVAMFFNKKASKTIYEWGKENAGNRRKVSLEPYVSKVSEYIDFLAAPKRPEFSEAIEDSHIRKLIDQAKAEYDIVLVDTAPFMEGVILTALEKSDQIFLLTMLDLPTLKNTNRFMETLESLNMKDKVKIVISRDLKKKMLKDKTAEKILHTSVYMTIPDAAKIVIPSVNEGRPFVRDYPKAKISKVICKVVQDLDPSEEKEPVKKWMHKPAMAGRRT
ncbi:ParA family protein [Halobacillus fulvus]|nr:ParA family protein [Halobacillus fulvus]